MASSTLSATLKSFSVRPVCGDFGPIFLQEASERGTILANISRSTSRQQEPWVAPRRISRSQAGTCDKRYRRRSGLGKRGIMACPVCVH